MQDSSCKIAAQIFTDAIVVTGPGRTAYTAGAQHAEYGGYGIPVAHTCSQSQWKQRCCSTNKTTSWYPDSSHTNVTVLKDTAFGRLIAACEELGFQIQKIELTEICTFGQTGGPDCLQDLFRSIWRPARLAQRLLHMQASSRQLR